MSGIISTLSKDEWQMVALAARESASRCLTPTAKRTWERIQAYAETRALTASERSNIEEPFGKGNSVGENI